MIGAIFEFGLPFDHKMMPGKLRDHISNGSRVIVLTDRQTKSQTDTTENNSTLAAIRCVGGKYT